MTYPLDDLRRLRTLREDRARREAGAAEGRLRQAAAETGARQKALEDYRVWRAAEAARRYESIMGVNLSLKELDGFKAGLAALETEEGLLAEAAVASEKREAEARRELAERRAKLAETNRALEKISRHREEWLSAEAREQDRREDLELEEFPAVRTLTAGLDD